MKKFTRTEPEFIGAPLTCEMPDSVDVNAMLDNGWILADKKTEKVEVKDDPKDVKKEDKPVVTEKKEKSSMKNRQGIPLF